MNPDETVIAQEDQILADPGYSYNDIKEESVRDIATNTEEPKAPEDIEEKKEETVVEPPKEEPKEDIDVDKIATEAAEKALAEQKRLAEEAEAARIEEEKANVDKYEEFTKNFEKDNNRLPTWKEVAQWQREGLKEEILQQIKQDEEAKIATEKAERERKELEYTQQLTRVNEIIDSQLDELYEKNLLTKILNKDNPSDQGVVERKALFQALLEKNQEIDRLNAIRQTEGKPLLPAATLKEAYYDGYKKPNAQPAGGDIPINTPRGAHESPNDEPELDYARDVANKSWRLFRR